MSIRNLTTETGVSIGVLASVIILTVYIVNGFGAVDTRLIAFGYEQKALTVKVDSIAATLDSRPSREEIIWWTEKLADRNKGTVDVPLFPRKP